jgi:predicted nucleotide-binding protein (sugar kinase/HSP70/actin superfamily)
MLYYRYQALWETFFRRLNCDVIASDETNRQILNDGIRFSIDESCLPSKVYMGHVYSLIDKCDYILVPRIVSYGRREQVCVKFNALYDIVRNTFPQAGLIHYNIDYRLRRGEAAGFIHMGRILGKSRLQSLSAYRHACRAQAAYDRQGVLLQQSELTDERGPKILIVAHPYNARDPWIGGPVVRLIERMGGVPLFADAADRPLCLKHSREISRSLYWVYNKELIGSIKLLEDVVDGVILLTAFPCGPDSLVNELVLRRIRDIPTIHIILDELQGEAGLQTRIESFIDILNMKSGGEVISCAEGH